MKPEVMKGLGALALWAIEHPETAALLSESIREVTGDTLCALEAKRANRREFKCCVSLDGPGFRPTLTGFNGDDYPLREKLKRGLGKVVFVSVRIQDEPEEQP